MQILIQYGRVVGTAGDDYSGPNTSLPAPDGFDFSRMDEYRYVEGVLLSPVSSQLTKRAFRARFLGQEKAGIELASLDDPTAPLEQRMQAAFLRATQADLASATFIDLQDLATRNGVLMMEAAGLLAPGRAQAILGAPISAEERPL